MNKELIAHLESFVTNRRKELFDDILQYRTRYITVALEDIFQSQNASAVLRTCDCFGVQDVHIIEKRNEYTLNPLVTQGSDKWLNLKRYNTESDSSVNTIRQLKKQGYRIVATTPHTNDTNLGDLDLSKGKIALFFGTEMQGLTQDVLDNADEYLKIPMYGFTESFNISVSAAIILHTLTEKLRTLELNWQLNQKDKDSIKLDWLRKSVKGSALIEKEFTTNSSNNQRTT